MTTFNGAEFLAEQLSSLARQELLPSELHIGDDGSTDTTERIVRDFAARAHFPVHFHKNETRLGFGENFIRTAQRCSQDWIAFCDQDDVWAPQKLKWAAAAIENGPADLMLLAHNAVMTDEGLNPGNLLHDFPAGDTITGRLQLPPEWYSWGFTQIFRSQLLRDIPSSDRVSIPWHKHRNAHDVWVALLANCTGSILRSNQSLTLYRRHQGAVSADSTPLLGFERSGSGYAQRASYLKDVSLRLKQCAGAVEANLADLLNDSASRIHQFARQLDTRGHAYSAPSLTRRLSNIRALVVEGAYVGGSLWPFGLARLGKDLLCAFRLL